VPSQRGPKRWWPIGAVALSAVSCRIAFAADPTPDATASYRVVADTIPEPFAAGDAAQGRALVAARDPANCVLCHTVPDAAIPFAGNLGPLPAGVGADYRHPNRLRVVDNLRVNPQTIMPGELLQGRRPRTCRARFRGKSILTAPQVEDVVAYLATLR
jgi:sulfur-oxidizing protein SoxX